MILFSLSSKSIIMLIGSENSPPAFAWDTWYASVGGRSLHIDRVDEILNEIKIYQYPRFDGPVNSDKRIFNSPEETTALIKQKAFY